MTKVSDKFCILPFISVEAQSQGKAKVCCYNTEDLQHGGKQINFKEDTLTSAFYCDSMDRLRTAFLNNKMPGSCKLCWDIEEAGGKSKRLLSNEKFRWFVNKLDHSKPSLKFLNLELGNICNLKCRICNRFCSSKWVSDDILLYDDLKEQILTANKLGAWPREAEEFWKDAENIVDHLYTIYFAGGEPFLIEEQFALLDHCVKTNNAKRIDVTYNTNGTHFPINAIENIWPYFRKVSVSFSIDAMNTEFEYQRYGASWATVLQNIKLMHATRDKNSWLSTQLCATVSILNVLSIIDLFSWAESMGFDSIVLNLLHNPMYFNLRHLSLDKKLLIKKQVLSRINEIKNYDLYQQIQSMINYMMLDGEDLSEACIANLEKIDKIRNQNWHTSLPKLTEIFNDQ